MKSDHIWSAALGELQLQMTHATFDTWNLGNRASHGCVRLEIGNAEELYNTVFATGKEDTYIVIQE